MKKDIVEKGGVLQRDKETYAIAPHIPGGLTDVATLRNIADVAERYGAEALKLTSAQRIAIIGLKEDDLDKAWADLGENVGQLVGMCVRSVKICPGTTYCKRGQQNSVEVGLEMDERYHGLTLPWKCKMGISGCLNDCGEVCVKDVGLIGNSKGWNLMVGGNGGGMARLSKKLVTHIPTDAEALVLVDRVMNWVAKQDRRVRVGKYIEEMGLDAFRDEVLGDIPFDYKGE